MDTVAKPRPPSQDLEIEKPTQGELAGLDWVRRNSWPSEPSQCSPLAIADLFSGCGGMTLGAWEAARVNNRSIDVRLAVDVEPTALSVYGTNFPPKPGATITSQKLESLFDRSLGEAQSSTEEELSQQVGPLHLLLAGPPCQGHSDLNNRTRRNDPRNALYLSAIRAAEVLKPDIVIIENVPTVIHDVNGVVIQSDDYLDQIGYHVTHDIVNASNFGTCQARRRHLLVATRWPHTNPFPEGGLEPKRTLRDYIGDLVDEPDSSADLFRTPSRMGADNRARAKYLFETDSYDLPNQYRPKCHRDKRHSYVSMYGRLHWDRQAQTLTSGFGSMGQGRYLHPERIRTMTPHEAARIQGFPDFFNFSEVRKRTKLQETIANAVPPAIVAKILDSLLCEGVI